MFESLSDRLGGVFRKLGGRASLDEESVREAVREVRLALLDADVNLHVARSFTDTVLERCIGMERSGRMTPAQQVLEVVHAELIALLGGETGEVDLSGRPPHILMLVGLQGSGKTTTAAKLAAYFRDRGMKPYFAPADVNRPAAVEQLASLAAQLDMPCYPSTPVMNPVDIARNATREAAAAGCDLVLLDTAGRLHIDEALMQELVSVKEAVHPAEILFTADAMSGQDAATVAGAFDRALNITGVILTKMDGDARGGAALSVRSVTGKSIKFVGVGEKISELELFHPDRVAGRILGMGDMLTLIEKARETVDREEAEELERKFRKAEFNFEDFRTQMRKMKQLGSLEGLLKLIPGFGDLRRKIGDAALPDKEMARFEAMICSMTGKERRDPKIINPSRKRRIAEGSGMSVADVNRLLKQFDQMRGMMQRMAGGGGKMPRGLPGIGGVMPRMPFGGLPGLDASSAPGTDFGGAAAATPRSADEQKKLRQKRKDERRRKKKNRR
ncbi:MAG: signal recognition particle protein [Desulfovibrio sp.]|jgi:signal recognition particle subunit SRP54|nr:signal recognition particle protein [Desulfovibrio sp.]